MTNKIIAGFTLLFATLAFFAYTHKPTTNEGRGYANATYHVRPNGPIPIPTPVITAEQVALKIDGKPIETILVLKVVDNAAFEQSKGKLVQVR